MARGRKLGPSSPKNLVAIGVVALVLGLIIAGIYFLGSAGSGSGLGWGLLAGSVGVGGLYYYYYMNGGGGGGGGGGRKKKPVAVADEYQSHSPVYVAVADEYHQSGRHSPVYVNTSNHATSLQAQIRSLQAQIDAYIDVYGASREYEIREDLVALETELAELARQYREIMDKLIKE